jgi:formate dehydrogenase subunit gamma
MATQTRIRVVSLLMLGLLLLFLFSGILYWQAYSADLSNPRSDFWRIVRQGFPAYTSTPSQGHTILIQNGGENWREIRNGLLIPYSQGLLAIAVAAVGLLYLFTGGEKLEKPRSGIMIERHTLAERVLHWYTAVLFIIMGVTGLNILLGRLFLMPVFGHPFVAGYLGASKVLHNYSGPLLVAGFFLELVVWIRYNIFKRSDWAWFKNMGGMLGRKGGPRPHVGKYNAGQKAWFWLVIAFGSIIGCTGVLLDFPLWGQTRFTMEFSHVIHATVGVLFVAVSLGHMYMGSLGTEGTFEGIWKGSVDKVWAEQHADLWYAEKRGGIKENPGIG